MHYTNHTKTMRFLTVKYIISLVLFLIGLNLSLPAQSDLTGVQKLVAAQDQVINVLANQLAATNEAPKEVAAIVRELTSSLTLLQRAEDRAYALADKRDSAPQDMTAKEMEKAMEQATALGVSRPFRNNVYTEWRGAKSLSAASLAISKLNGAIAEQEIVVSQYGSIRRALPSWMPWSVTSYADYRSPQPPETTILATLKAWEQKLTGKTTILGTVTPATSPNPKK